MAKCDYCGGEHRLAHCPNCGAPGAPRTITIDGVNVSFEVHEFQRRFWSAVGIPEYYGEVGSSPVVPKGDPPRRPQYVMFR